MSISHDLRLKTSLPYAELERLLGMCCTKRYSMTLDGLEVGTNGPRKVIRIAFEDPADREQFSKSFKRSRDESPASKMPPPPGVKDRRRPLSPR